MWDVLYIDNLGGNRNRSRFFLILLVGLSSTITISSVEIFKIKRLQFTKSTREFKEKGTNCVEFKFLRAKSVSIFS